MAFCPTASSQPTTASVLGLDTNSGSPINSLHFCAILPQPREAAHATGSVVVKGTDASIVASLQTDVMISITVRLKAESFKHVHHVDLVQYIKTIL